MPSNKPNLKFALSGAEGPIYANRAGYDTRSIFKAEFSRSLEGSLSFNKNARST